MELKDLGEFITSNLKTLESEKEKLLKAAQLLLNAQNLLNAEFEKRGSVAQVEEPEQEEAVQEEVAEVKEEVVQEEVKEETVETPAPQPKPQEEKPQYVATDFGRGVKREQRGDPKPFNRDGRPPFNKDGKPFNRDGKPGFNPQKPGFGKNQGQSSYVASDVVEKKDTQKIKKNPQKPIVDDKKEKGGLSKRDLFKRGYEYDSSLERMDDEDEYVRIRSGKKEKKHEPIQKVEITEATLTSDIVPLKVFSEKIGKPASELVKKFFELGKMITINSSISYEEAELIAMDYGITLTLEKEKTAEDKLEELVNAVDTNEKMVKRPPIVTIMGHVDHGKTSLLDYIRKTNVIATEAGGITQHIGAYTIDVRGEKITFLDTPGHEAFTAMRKRGAQVTDIAIIVVAADDAIMPQTIEAINHAKEAGVSIIIAANKIDKTNGDYSKVLQQLPNYDLLPEEWGGDTIVCPISAKSGQGVDKLLDSVLLVAEMLDLKATKKVPATGSIIEARLDKAIGPVATVLVKNGTLKIKDFLVAGTNICRVRAMTDCTGKACKEAYPSYAVQIQGFQSVPNAGDTFIVVKDEKLAKHVAEERIEKERNAMQATSTRTLEDLLKEQSGEVKVLAIIIKSDVQGTCEAVKQALLKINEERVDDNVKIKVVHAGVGAINESDIMLADTTNAIVLGFNVRPEAKAKAQAERDGIDIRTYSIIYDAIDDINAALSGMIAPTYKETALGMVEIRDLFKITGVGMIAGCYVLEGKIARNCGYRLLRDNLVIHTGKIASLKRMKDDAKEVAAGYECGVGLDNFTDFKVGDILETFLLEEEKHE